MFRGYCQQGSYDQQPGGYSYDQSSYAQPAAAPPPAPAPAAPQYGQQQSYGETTAYAESVPPFLQLFAST